jgi:hypothetical protein
MMRKRSNGGQLLIGHRDWSRYCSEGASPRFLSIGGTGFYWSVDGAIGFANQFIPTEWVFDTGATAIHVHLSVFQMLINELHLRGTQLVSAGMVGQASTLANCQDFTRRFPSLTVYLGSFKLVIRPQDYINGVVEGGAFCFLNVMHNGPGPNLHSVLGAGMLSKLLTIFDLDRRAVGFCRLASKSA